MSSNQNQIVKQKADTVRAALEKLKPQITMALPKHLTPDRLLRVTMTAVQNNPKLLECDRTSLFAAVMSCAQLGLEPDGVLGQAYLVPFKAGKQMKVQLIPGYKGYLTLARNSGEISSIQAHEVCERDHFAYAYGLNEHLNHVPAEGDRGKITHFYAYAKFKDGGYVFEVMTRAEVDAIRDKSEGYKAFKAGYIKSAPWDSHYVQMGRKTAIRRLANYLPMSVQRAAALDGAYEESGKHGSIDNYGDVVIEGESEELPDEQEAQANGAANASSKLDSLAGDEGEPDPAANANGEDKPKAKGKGKAKDEPEAEQGSARFVVGDEAEIIDQETGEIVPEDFVTRHEDGTFSVARAYFQPTTAAKPEADGANGAGLFGAEG